MSRIYIATECDTARVRSAGAEDIAVSEIFVGTSNKNSTSIATTKVERRDVTEAIDGAAEQFKYVVWFTVKVLVPGISEHIAASSLMFAHKDGSYTWDNNQYPIAL